MTINRLVRLSFYFNGTFLNGVLGSFKPDPVREAAKKVLLCLFLFPIINNTYFTLRILRSC